MSISELIRAMAQAGAPTEAIAIAVEAIEAAQSQVAEKRAVERDRKRKQRERSRDSHGTVTGQSGDIAENPSPSLSPQTPQSHPHPSNNKPARVRGTRLPNDWQPCLTGEMAETVKAWPTGAVERELGRFRDWAASATGPNAIKSDWQAAWRNWLRKAEDEGRYGRPTSPRSVGPPGKPDLVAHILAK